MRENVVGKLLGGLGNHLFIIFTVISYCIDNQKTPKFFLVPDKRKHSNAIFKNIDLYKISDCVYKEKFHHYSPIPLFTTDVTFDGYFQSWKYFHHNKDKIMRKIGILELRRDTIKKYPNFSNFDISMHFRLGDYKHKKQYHPICSIEYYVRALEYFSEEKNVLYFFEEEDRNTIQENIKILKEKFPDKNFTSIDTKIADYEQLFLMSSCKNNIIANSSFSWWGAYFSIHDNRVVYPDRWFGEVANLNVKDCPLEEWIMVKT